MVVVTSLSVDIIETQSQYVGCVPHRVIEFPVPKVTGVCYPIDNRQQMEPFSFSKRD